MMKIKGRIERKWIKKKIQEKKKVTAKKKMQEMKKHTKNQKKKKIKRREVKGSLNIVVRRRICRIKQ